MSECYQQTAPVLSASTIIDDDTSGRRPERIGLVETVDGAAAGNGNERPVKVVVLGEEGVGKTALLQQFMTSEYMAAVQTNFGMYCLNIKRMNE
jgi:Ras of Complex, Roc, domain of DAPkinase